MIKMITGGPGDGKTLLAITRILQEIERNKKANALGEGAKGYEALREFRTNIKGAVGRIPGLLPLEKDWRQYPDGSYLVYDESHQKGWFRTTGRPGLSDDDIITELDEHRHRGFDITFITQFPTKIHNEVRALCKLHTHLHRSMGLERATLWEFSRCINDPYDEKAREGADETIWPFPSENYQYYDSATIHTHKFVMPAKFKNLFITAPIIVLVFVGLFFFLIPDDADIIKSVNGELFNSKASGGGALAPPLPTSHTSTRPGMEWTTAEVLPELKGCAKLTNSCRCWNGEGRQLDLDLAQCLNLVSNPLPMSFAVSDRQGENHSGMGSAHGGALDRDTQKETEDRAVIGTGTDPASVGTTVNRSNGWLK